MLYCGKRRGKQAQTETLTHAPRTSSYSDSPVQRAGTHAQTGGMNLEMRLALDWRARATIHRSANGSAARGRRGRGRGTLWYCYTSVCLSTCCKLWPLAVAVCFVATVFCIVNHLTRLFHLPFYQLVFLLYFIYLIFDGPFIPCETTTVCFADLVDSWRLENV